VAFSVSHYSVGPVGGGATQIVNAVAGNVEVWISVSNGTVYLGGDSGVTTANGLARTSSAPPLQLHVRPDDVLYAVSDSGGPYTVYVMTRSA
jgi:hypothetical protein